MILLNIENISKAYTDKVLFQDISFGINQGDKIGLIGINGTGKTTLLKILADLEKADSGRIIRSNNINIEYLPQNIDFDLNASVIEQVFRGTSENMLVLKDYNKAITNPNTPKEEIIKLSQKMDSINGWELESEAKTILTKLGIYNFDEEIKNLSGGQKKRVALASALINPSDLLILDEPTNHLDNETISWLEGYLSNRKSALLMITHDRYFLNRVVNQILELDGGNLYSYKGNYSYFIEKKAEREEMELATERKRRSLYRNEMAWMKQGVRARGTRQKARVERFKELESSALDESNSDLEISVASSRLGRKVIEINKISKSYDGLKLIEDFSYTLLRDDRIGILGGNGLGKSTLLKIIGKELEPDAGDVEIGETVKIGFFSQEVGYFDENQRAIEYIKEGGEFVSTADGRSISASEMMEEFLFPKDLQWAPIGKMSGGERRRLNLLRILMESPNVLLLDEPTNDLDIQTLTILEEYIDGFPGAVVIVSHDRYLLDKVVEKVFVFEGETKIKQYTGNYQYFKSQIEKEEAVEEKPVKKESSRKARKTIKFSYNEQREWENIDDVIQVLEYQIKGIDQKMQESASQYSRLQELLKEKEEVEKELEEKMERWLFLSEKLEEIEG